MGGGLEDPPNVCQLLSIGNGGTFEPVGFLVNARGSNLSVSGSSIIGCDIYLCLLVY